MSADDKLFWMAARQALLMLLDALERRLEISPRTAELRKQKGLNCERERDIITLTN